ncbi:MAG: SulP family inorganic anion transporter, partial [Halanaerobiaceae bacterium]
FVATFLTTILTPRVDYAIYLGVVISAVMVLKHTSEVRYSHISYDNVADRFVSHEEIEDDKENDFIIINLVGTMYFNAAEVLRRS